MGKNKSLITSSSNPRSNSSDLNTRNISPSPISSEGTGDGSDCHGAAHGDEGCTSVGITHLLKELGSGCRWKGDDDAMSPLPNRSPLSKRSSSPLIVAAGSSPIRAFLQKVGGDPFGEEPLLSQASNGGSATSTPNTSAQAVKGEIFHPNISANGAGLLPLPVARVYKNEDGQEVQDTVNPPWIFFKYFASTEVTCIWSHDPDVEEDSSEEDDMSANSFNADGAVEGTDGDAMSANPETSLDITHCPVGRNDCSEEYGTEGRVSTKGDAYSFGIMLLETFTRKKPTDEMFTEGLSLRQWVNLSFPDQIVDVVDENLLNANAQGISEISLQRNLLAVLDLGLDCSKDSPEERLEMKDVVTKLNKIMSQILSE